MICSLWHSREYAIIGVIAHAKALEFLSQEPADLVLVDATPVGQNCLELVRRIRRAHKHTLVTMLSLNLCGTDWPAARRMGAIGSIARSLSLEEARAILRDVVAGCHPPPDGIASERAPTPSARQMDVLRLGVTGHSNKQIAAELGLGIDRVDELVAEVKKLTQASNWGVIALRSLAFGWIDLSMLPHYTDTSLNVHRERRSVLSAGTT